MRAIVRREEWSSSLWGNLQVDKIRLTGPPRIFFLVLLAMLTTFKGGIRCHRADASGGSCIGKMKERSAFSGEELAQESGGILFLKAGVYFRSVVGLGVLEDQGALSDTT